MTKIIIAGSRYARFTLDDVRTAISRMIPDPSSITTVISGTAPGVDRIGELWALENQLAIERYPADWAKHGRSAGFKRNEQMAEHADLLLALWDGQSNGTRHMIHYARSINLPTYVYP